jgi:hypothetical protein
MPEKSWLPGSSDPSILIKFKRKIFTNFRKKLKTILDVVNDILYKHAKSQCKIIFTMGNTKSNKM